MWRKSAGLMAIIVLTAAKAAAQDPRVEISATAGWTFSNGVEADSSLTVPGVGTFTSIDPKDAFSWGLRLGFFAGENSEIGFLFNQQPTELELGGTTTVKLGDMKINNYHGYYAYNFGDGDAAVRPYLLFGLGATQYGKVTATVGGTSRDIAGRIQVLRHRSLRSESLPGRECRRSLRRSLDTDLYHDDNDGLVVRPLLGLLPCRKFQSTRTSSSWPPACRSDSDSRRLERRRWSMK